MRKTDTSLVSINVELPERELAALKQLAKLDDDAEAVRWAAREYIRVNRLRELKTASGKVDFNLELDKLQTR